MKSTFTVIDSHHYPIELEQAFANAKQRIVLSAMIILADDATVPLFEALSTALKRGVSVTIAPDAYTNYIFSTTGNVFKARQRIDHTTKWLQKLKGQGATVTFLGSLGINPYKQRFHQKFTVIDDEVYCGGGVNLSIEHFKLTDYMLHRKDPILAGTLIAQLNRIIDEGFIDDESSGITSTSELLVDGGRPGKSLIYQRAVELSKRATSITFVSQFCPSGELATILRRKSAQCYFNRPLQTKGPAIFSQLVDQARFRIHNSYQGEDYIHAKFILFTMHGGEKQLLSGSHNFSRRGVDYGTKEIAVESSDVALWRALEHFGERYVF